MSEKKIIAVIGATGAQGGGLARALLADPEGPFALRAVTRDATTDKARALADAGADVVTADLNDEDSLREAFAGVHGAYIVTDYWAVMSAQAELTQIANAVRAVKDAGVRHVIWSTLEDTRHHLPTSDPRYPTLDGTYTVPHFDAKDEANQLFADAGVPTTYLRTTFYWESFALFGPQRDDDGKLVLTVPMGDRELAGIASEDIGRTALGVFRHGDELVGQTVHIAGEHLTGTELAEAFADELGEPVSYRPLTHDEFRALGFPGADLVGNMFQYYYEASEDFTGARDLDRVRSLNPRLQTFRTWLHTNKHLVTPR